VVTPEQWLVQAQQLLAQARGQAMPVFIEGHGSKAFYGNARPVQSLRLSTADYSGIVNYDPTELVVVARAGTPIVVLEAALAEQGQCLAFEPPRFGPDRSGTVGGMVATGLSGPARLSAGSCRDALLGMTVLNSSGECLRFGGTVMKNVAGYDMTRLHAGALGTLGVILDVAIKVLPRPTSSLTVSASMDQASALSQTSAWLAQPLPIAATAWLPSGELILRLAGARAAVESAADRFEREMGSSRLRRWGEPEAISFWDSLRDQTHPFFSAPANGASLWRISVAPTSPVLSIKGGAKQREPLIEWGGGQRWLWSDAEAAEVRQAAFAQGGHATRFRATGPQIDAFTPVSGILHDIHSRLKAELDPHGLLEPGRLYQGI
jgi:glycolate oxidase FAD binding subunit